MSERRSDLRPALAVSGGLHLAVLLALLISWRFAPPMPKPLQVVAVSIISNAPVANVRPAEQAPERQAAAEPEPEPSPEPPSPVEAPAPPAPAPPPPAPAPQPRPRPRPHPRVTPQPAPEPEPTPPPPPRPRRAPKPVLEPTPEPAPKPQPRPKPRPTPRPQPRPAPEPPAPEPKPAPEPTPPKARPTPKAKPKPAPKTAPDLDLDSLSKSTGKHAAAKSLDLSALSKAQAREQSLDLTALSASPGKGRAQKHALDLSALAGSPGGHHANAAKGAAHAETDRTARQAAGAATGLDAASVGALKAKITRLWNPECGVKVDVRMILRADHSLAAKPTILAHSTGDADAAKVASATQHALAAVEQAAPFSELPANAPRDLVLHFTPTDGCSG